ncbi:hypothetical protein Acr_00g0017160 [Actinidia rufa]|uniref:DUF641 domain-containing protein n=1 Tax=Actinidia rufa TaxID=165716 RepID=A0A7J0DB32_9ERIC|nr:hypothetical protein Acr_00g0017160 [Actinidia rufa]
MAISPIKSPASPGIFPYLSFRGSRRDPLTRLITPSIKRPLLHYAKVARVVPRSSAEVQRATLTVGCSSHSNSKQEQIGSDVCQGFLHIRAVTGVAPVDGIHKTKSHEKVKHDCLNNGSQSVHDDNEKLQHTKAVEAFLSKLFASISTVKAAYAQLQFSQSPF